MIRSQVEAASESQTALGIEDILKEAVRGAFRQCADIASVAVGDASGLPIVNATKGKVPVMSYTSMATMSLRAAKTAVEAVAMAPPEYIVVHTRDGMLVVLTCEGSEAVLIAHLRENANLGLALTILKRLASSIGDALQD